MILQCSECKARYLVPDQAIGDAGRTVRCANCSHTWFEHPVERTQSEKDELDKMLESIVPAPVATKPIPKGSNLPTQRREPIPAGVKASMALALVVAIALAILVFRPALYGFPPSRGLELADIVMIKMGGDKVPSYQLSGKITNTSKDAMTLPTLRITAVDSDGRSLQFWDYAGEGKVLAPGESIPFASNLEVRMTTATRFVVELGNSLELTLRRKPSKQPQA